MVALLQPNTEHGRSVGKRHLHLVVDDGSRSASAAWRLRPVLRSGRSASVGSASFNGSFVDSQHPGALAVRQAEAVVGRFAGTGRHPLSVGFGGLLAMIALVLACGLLMVRVAQGGPAADDRQERPAVASGVESERGPDDLVVVARPGDSLWSVAGRVAPDHDRRAAVSVLADVNGGESLQNGQQIVVPGQLLD